MHAALNENFVKCGSNWSGFYALDLYNSEVIAYLEKVFDTFFIDPYGDVMPCNGTKDKEVMGNLNTQTWDELWNSLEAEMVRKGARILL